MKGSRNASCAEFLGSRVGAQEVEELVEVVGRDVVEVDLEFGVFGDLFSQLVDNVSDVRDCVGARRAAEVCHDHWARGGGEIQLLDGFGEHQEGHSAGVGLEGGVLAVAGLAVSLTHGEHLLKRRTVCLHVVMVLYSDLTFGSHLHRFLLQVTGLHWNVSLTCISGRQGVEWQSQSYAWSRELVQAVNEVDEIESQYQPNSRFMSTKLKW